MARAKPESRMPLQVDDELLFEVPKAEAKATAETVRKVMEGAPHPAVHLDVPPEVDAGTGPSWSEAH